MTTHVFYILPYHLHFLYFTW